MNGQDRFRVVVAGGGVAAVEALLALRELAPHRIEPVLLAPGPDFVHQPLAVAEPFGAAEPHRISLAKVAADTGATLWPGTFAGLHHDERVALTGAGDRIPFDALLIAVGVRRLQALPGVVTYRGGVDNAALTGVLQEAQRGRIQRLAFVAPASVRWTLAIYDLALLTARWLREREAETQVSLITHEARPLQLFGQRGSDAVASLLREADIELRTAQTAVALERRKLVLASGSRIPADQAVALPKVAVPGLIGVPQGPDGYIGTDRDMRVEGLPRVYAAGDATWFPLKQGGIAAQQADAAASAIAALADQEVAPEPFRPVLRGAVLTGAHPLFLRSTVGARDDSSAASEEPLWWPPSKVAGRHLAGYLRDSGFNTEVGGPLADLDEPLDDQVAENGAEESEHRSMVELSLRAADLDAADGDFSGALRWLQVVEDLDLSLPMPYGDRREQWRRAAVGGQPCASQVGEL